MWLAILMALASASASTKFLLRLEPGSTYTDDGIGEVVALELQKILSRSPGENRYFTAGVLQQLDFLNMAIVSVKEGKCVTGDIGDGGSVAGSAHVAPQVTATGVGTNAGAEAAEGAEAATNEAAAAEFDAAQFDAEQLGAEQFDAAQFDAEQFNAEQIAAVSAETEVADVITSSEDGGNVAPMFGVLRRGTEYVVYDTRCAASLGSFAQTEHGLDDSLCDELVSSLKKIFSDAEVDSTTKQFFANDASAVAHTESAAAATDEASSFRKYFREFIWQ